MKALLRKLLGVRPSAVTFNDVAPAPRDPEIEKKIKEAQTELVQAKMRSERTSWEIRQELAGSALAIVSGGQS